MNPDKQRPDKCPECKGTNTKWEFYINEEFMACLDCGWTGEEEASNEPK